MSNFTCQYCGTVCYDTPTGYVTGCEHYPPDTHRSTAKLSLEEMFFDMPSKAKRKGADAEREIARLLSDAFQLNISRNLEQAHGGGYDLSGLKELSLAVEVKHQKTPRIKQWWQQAKDQAKLGSTVMKPLVPVLIYKLHYKPWTVMLDLSDLLYTSGSVTIETDLEGFIYLIQESPLYD